MPAEYLATLCQIENRRFFKCLRTIDRGALGLHLYVTWAIVVAHGTEKRPIKLGAKFIFAHGRSIPAGYLVSLRQGENRRFFKRLRAINKGALELRLYVTQAIAVARGAE